MYQEPKFDQEENRITYTNISDRFGKIPLVNASVNLLFSFLLKNLKYLSTRNKENFEPVAKWASNSLSKVVDIRNKIVSCFTIVAFDFPYSKSMEILNCELRYNEDNSTICYCNWYRSKNFVPQHIYQENKLTLSSGKIHDLIDQICIRIKKLINAISYNNNCDFDFTVKNLMEKSFKNLNDVKNQTEEILKIYDNLKNQTYNNKNPSRPNKYYREKLNNEDKNVINDHPENNIKNTKLYNMIDNSTSYASVLIGKNVIDSEMSNQ